MGGADLESPENQRDPFLVALERFWQHYFTAHALPFDETSPSKESFLQHHDLVNAWRLHPERARQELIVPFFGLNVFREKLFENPLVCDCEALKGRVFSAGTAPTAEQPHYQEMLNDLEAIFQAHQANGAVTIEHDTQAYYGHLHAEVTGDRSSSGSEGSLR